MILLIQSKAKSFFQQEGSSKDIIKTQAKKPTQGTLCKVDQIIG